MNDLSHILKSALKDVKGKKFDGPYFPANSDDIKKIRSDHKLSQREFAARIGVAVDTVKSWESGRRKPSALASKSAAWALFGKAETKAVVEPFD
ncbi:MAG: helix-turn-helix domain-containing protein [Rhizobiaceae bacterium]